MSSRGGILFEFCVVSLILYMIIASMMTFGRTMYSAQAAQSAIDLAARELSRTALPATWTFEQARDDASSEFKLRVYSDEYLAIDVTSWYTAPPPQGSLYDYLDSLTPPVPPVNRALYPVMFLQEVGGQVLFRYPGALIERQALDPVVAYNSGYKVEIPTVVARDPSTGIETVEWVQVIEEIGTDPFPVNSPEGGLVALRLHLPIQAPEMGGFRDTPGGTLKGTYGYPNIADDASVTALNSPATGTPVDPVSPGLPGPYAGVYGLGRQHNPLAGTVRPYRKLITSQAIYRREVFQ
ncbi:MAG: TadE family protein [Candidatus Sumerlaeia bacterium]|nr:TadE family protein [Candidatus Sumerlaeia bacterium]